MDWIKFPDKIMDFSRKYRYAFIVFAIGLVLMCLPKLSLNEEKTELKDPVQTENEISQKEEMEEILSKISGAGKVSVMLTDRSGAETIYQTDRQESQTDDNLSVKTQTVVISTGNNEKTYLIRQVNPPQYLGAVIVCQGADNPQIRLAIVDAVSKLTGLGANSISVLKMK